MLKFKPTIAFFLVLHISCKAQTQNVLLSPDSAHNDNGQPRLTKTQGTGQFANVHCSLQDKTGNLWFGTTGEGVYRYDGKGFTQFTKKDGLTSNTVWSIIEDKKGNIWIGTDSGLCLYKAQIISKVPISITNGHYFYLYNKPNTDASQKNIIWSLLEDKSGRIWIGQVMECIFMTKMKATPLCSNIF